MSDEKMTIEKFVEKLAKWKPEDDKLGDLDIINMYNDDKNYGQSIGEKYSKTKNVYIDNWVNEAKKRQERLFHYLKRMNELNPSRLFVGEAPGIDGCYRTGIPFTSEAIISGAQTSTAFSWYFKDSQIHCEKEKREPTSTIVWGCLDHLGCLDQICKLLSKIPFIKGVKSLPQGVKLPLLWNIFPFQPLEDNKKGKNKKKNRPPEDMECQVGIEFLIKLLKCFSIKEIYSIGDKAKDTLNSKPALEALEKLKKMDEKYKNIELKIGHIRHPSNDPKKDFITQFNIIYQITIIP